MNIAIYSYSLNITASTFRKHSYLVNIIFVGRKKYSYYVNMQKKDEYPMIWISTHCDYNINLILSVPTGECFPWFSLGVQ